MIKVDCLMPTLPSRDHMRERAIASFTAQDLIPENWQVQLKIDAEPASSFGAKLNRMIGDSSADIIVLLDDDDWHHPIRVCWQVWPLIAKREIEVTGTSQIYYFDHQRTEPWLYSGDPRNWVGGMAFLRSVWDRRKFTDSGCGADTEWQHKSKAKVLDLRNPNLFIAGLHNGNTCPKRTGDPGWRPATMRELPREFLATIPQQELVRA